MLMARMIQHLERRLMLTGVCLVLLFAMTGCSAFQSNSYLAENEPAVSSAAIASVDGHFVAEPFSLVAADSVGLATFGFEVAMWAEKPSEEALAQQD